MVMAKSAIQWCLFGLFFLCVGAVSAQVNTQTNKAKPAPPTADAKTALDKKPSAGPFHAKLMAVDKAAKTITVGKRTFQITSETKFFKAGKSATIADGVVGEQVSGYVKPDSEGKLVATKVNFGPKPEAKGTTSKK
jgi:hypothetical protein